MPNATLVGHLVDINKQTSHLVDSGIGCGCFDFLPCQFVWLPYSRHPILACWSIWNAIFVWLLLLKKSQKMLYWLQVMSHKDYRIHLPGTIQQPMLLELLEFIKGFVVSNEQFEKVDLNNLVLVCSLLCNLIHCALLSRYLFYFHLLVCFIF